MIVIQTTTLSQILRITNIILEEIPGIPPVDLESPLEIAVTHYQWLSYCEEPVILGVAPDIIRGDIRFWNHHLRKYLDIFYDSTNKILTIDNSRQYFISDPL